tara:strand:- start:4030 stop:8334 length:4305 start_codon:yes stop_codon:yes gene_type:complete
MMEEIELGSNEVEVEENIYNTQSTPTDKNQKKTLLADRAAATVSSGGDLVQSMEDSAVLSAEELQTNATQTYQNDQAQLLTDTIEYVAAEKPEDLEVVVKNAPNKFKEIEAAGASKLTPYLGWVNSMEGSEKLSSTEKEAIAVDSLLLEAITTGMDKRAWYQTGWDIGGMMVVPDESYNAAELQSQLFGDEAGFTEWLGSADAFSNIAEFRNQLPTNQRVMFDERLVEVIQGVDDNQLQQVGMAMAILGRDQEASFSQSLEKVDALFIGGALGKGLFKGLRSLNVLNRVAKAGDARTAMKTADAVTASPVVAKEAGVIPVDAAGVGNPVKPEGVFTGAPDGVQREYRMYHGDITEALDTALDTLVVSVTPNTKEADDIAAAIRRNLAKNDDIENINIEQRIEGMAITYDVVDTKGVKTVNEFKEYTLDDLGGFIQKDAGMIASGLRFATSPNTIAGVDRKFFVQGAEAALFAKGRIGKSYTDAVDLALKPVKGNVKSLTKISNILKQVDGTDIELTYHTLVKEGVGGQRLTDKEFVSTLGLRRVLDDAWHTNNQTVRREMELRGSKAIDIDGETQYGRPYNDADSAYSAFSGDVENTIIVDRNGLTHKGMGLDELKLKYKEGQILVKNDGANELEWFSSPDGFVRYALVDSGTVGELPRTVLNKVKNYLPKLREDANYFVKNAREVTINGMKKRKDVTVAYAATETQARAYLTKLRQAAEDMGEKFIEGDWDIRFDREVGQGAMNSDALGVGGGLVRGKRKSTELAWAGDLDEGGRTDALESLQRYMSITSDRYAMSEWRLEARARVVNEVSSIPDIGDKARSESWGALRSLVADSNIKPQRKAKILSMYDQTSTMMMLPTKTDQAFQGAVRAIGEKFDRAGQEGIAKHMYKMHDKSVLDIAKGATFNLTLGMYNLVQIPVQLMGASVAVSINPIAATKAAPRWLMASTLDFVTNEKSAKAFLTKSAKDLDVDVNSMANDYAAWRKSGMYEAVVRGNADASSLASRLPYDAGFLRKGWAKTVEMGQTPYRMGELSNMRISFFTALEREKGLKGKSFKYDDATIGRVVSRAEQYRLNMSGANKTAFQKGIWALPTQFKQIYTKYMESMFGTHFNGWERARLTIGQMALFGAAGVPVLNHFTDGFLTNIVGIESGDLTAEELTTVKRGAVGWYINHELDIDALVSGRLTVSADVIEDIMKALTDERTPMFKTMMGASFTSGDKFYDLFGNMVLAGNMVLDEYLDDSQGLNPALKEAAYLVGESLLELPSSSRKWLAAKYLVDGMVRKSDGSPLYSENPELGDIIARAVGFGSQDMDDLYKLTQADFKRKDKLKALSTFYTSMLTRMEYGVREQLETTVEGSHINAALVSRMINREHPDDADEIWKAVVGKLQNPRDMKDKVIRDAIINAIGEFTGAANKVSIIKQKHIEDNNLGDK